MAAILSGAEAALEIDAQTSEISSELEELGISPTLAVIRVGENAADLSYERNIIRRAEKTGINVEIHTFSASCTEQELVILIHRLNKDAGIDGDRKSVV